MRHAGACSALSVRITLIVLSPSISANIKLALFAGNAIQIASGVAPRELFQEVSSAPAAMASIRAVLAVSALRGWPTKARDAV